MESWDDEAAANAEGEDHGLVLQHKIAKERELATKVVKIIRIVVVPLMHYYHHVLQYAGKLGSS